MSKKNSSPFPQKSVEIFGKIKKQLPDKSSQRAVRGTQGYFYELLLQVNETAKKLAEGDPFRKLVEMFEEMAQGYQMAFTTSLAAVLGQKHGALKALKKDMNSKKLAKLKLPAAQETLEESYSALKSEYEALQKETPILLQEALEKLASEWDRVTKIVAAGQSLSPEKQQAIDKVVLVAARNVGIPAEHILTVPGDAAALTFFGYIDNFAVLTLPQYSFNLPWEWSIIWHELAGYKARQLNSDRGRKQIQTDLGDSFLQIFLIVYLEISSKDPQFFHHLKEMKIEPLTDDSTPKDIHIFFNEVPGFKEKVEEFITTEVIREKLPQLKQEQQGEVYSAIESILTNPDSLSFPHQFQETVAKLLKKHTFVTVQSQNWTQDWLEELFEDAWSVLQFGQNFNDIFFEEILGRSRNLEETRHPTKKVRRMVADELVKLGFPSNQDDVAESAVDEQDALKDACQTVAREIFKFYSLINLTNPGQKFDKGNSDIIIEALQEAMENWINKGKTPDIRSQAFDKINGIDLKLISEMPMKLNLFWEGLPYDRLLAHSFVYVDFGVGTRITRTMDIMKSDKSTMVIKGLVINGKIPDLSDGKVKGVRDNLYCIFYDDGTKINDGYVSKSVWNNTVIKDLQLP